MNNTVILRSRPEGMPRVSDFAFEQGVIPSPKTGEMRLKAKYISVDPYLRGKMSGTYSPSFELNQPLSSRLIAEVTESKNEGFKTGDWVIGYMDWTKYQTRDGVGLQKIDAPLSAYLSVLGSTGLSAYFALLDIGRPQAGETLVVSGAAGAVGSIAGQIGKMMGCRVVGIVGTDEKAFLLKSRFGFDEAINYKTTPDIAAAVGTACPGGVDIYFDNVGGVISDGVIAHLNNYARVPVCGSISNYNTTEEQPGPRLLPAIVYKRLRLQGFLISDFVDRFPEGIAQLRACLEQGKLQYSETILEGFDKLPEAFIGLFEGRNEGKMIVEVK